MNQFMPKMEECGSDAGLLRWQKQPEFQKAYREARRAAFGQAIARLQQMSGTKTETRIR
jgi:hypothetical protein